MTRAQIYEAIAARTEVFAKTPLGWRSGTLNPLSPPSVNLYLTRNGYATHDLGPLDEAEIRIAPVVGKDYKAVNSLTNTIDKTGFFRCISRNGNEFLFQYLYGDRPSPGVALFWDMATDKIRPAVDHPHLEPAVHPILENYHESV